MFSDRSSDAQSRSPRRRNGSDPDIVGCCARTRKRVKRCAREPVVHLLQGTVCLATRTAGGAVTPQATVAVDPSFVPLEHRSICWSIAPKPRTVGSAGHRLAIKGPTRFDTFWGRGGGAQIAAAMTASGAAFVLLPKGIAGQIIAAQGSSKSAVAVEQPATPTPPLPLAAPSAEVLTATPIASQAPGVTLQAPVVTPPPPPPPGLIRRPPEHDRRYSARPACATGAASSVSHSGCGDGT